ncbi:1-acyl-sn-glycerol-3-phosphate acyltransferase [Formicincola oecophyllae]|uniref:1-acyl-sn-glycerol-3-phosphate acyltransferase n=1 Tax=Formicincola oecophyllae TaxID=2558361 RepID=A0A4Y6U7W9_9PROT|nr:lysophospholipid acyltransferase family protein [Formicincola oecophyllae]QDH13090.1 1-acyl-sn-glycerol-3-phosphate acyltransferase [Formicincola oecophyllae]
MNSACPLPASTSDAQAPCAPQAVPLKGGLARGTLFNLYFLLLTLAMGLAALPIRATRNQALALRYAQRWARAVLWGFEHLCHVPVKVTGQAHLQENIRGGKPMLILAQHQSFFDGFIWMNLVPRPAYVIKQELTRIPLVGPMLILAGMIPIDRKGGAAALKTMMEAVLKAQSEGRQVILFPQGTRTQPGEHVPLQAGAAALVRQAASQGRPPAVMPAITDSGLSWPRSPWRKHAVPLHVVVGTPLAVEGLKSRAVLEATQAAWSKLEASSGVNHKALPRIAPDRP